jgi:hypothetical protein
MTTTAATHTPAPSPLDLGDVDQLRLHFEVQQFLTREAKLLDDGQIDAWVGLFVDDATYRMPIVETVDRGQPTHRDSAILLWVARLEKTEATYPASREDRLVWTDAGWRIKSRTVFPVQRHLPGDPQTPAAGLAVRDALQARAQQPASGGEDVFGGVQGNAAHQMHGCRHGVSAPRRSCVGG